MSKKVQRQYSAELKASAVKMVIEELKTLSQVSQDLDIPLQTLHSWVNTYHTDYWCTDNHTTDKLPNIYPSKSFVFLPFNLSQFYF